MIGPFGEGRASFRTAFPPESESAPPELARNYPGKTHDVGWRAGDAAVREGALYLDGLLRPDDQAVAYVAAFVHSDRERAAALRIGSPGPVKIWVNGALVFAEDVVRPAVLDQDAAPVRLGRGWNRILIKTVVVDGAWRLYARLTEPSGAPLHLGGGCPSGGRQMGDGDGAFRREDPGRFARCAARTAGESVERRGLRRGVARSGARARLDRPAGSRRPRRRGRRAAFAGCAADAGRLPGGGRGRRHRRRAPPRSRTGR